jgi:uncharacterized SAM-binding protein YcdF (DUF218 family)
MKWVGVSLGLLLALQAAYFYALSSRQISIAPHADLCVVLSGNDARFEPGIRLMQSQNPSPYFMISSADATALRRYFEEWGMPGRAQVIPESRATTSVENALIVSRLAKERGFKSILMITSWYHLPRAYFLFKAYLFGSGIRLFAYAFDARPGDWFTEPIFRIELARFWGSLGRILTGRIREGSRIRVSPVSGR